VPQVGPKLEAALRRYRAAFGVVEVLELTHHRAEQDQAAPAGGIDDQEGGEDGRPRRPPLRRGAPDGGEPPVLKAFERGEVWDFAEGGATA
jgi:hypothetical protein